MNIVINNIQNTIQAKQIILSPVSLIEKNNIVQHLIINYFSQKTINIVNQLGDTHPSIHGNQNLLMELLYNIYYFSFKKMDNEGKLIVTSCEKVINQKRKIELTFQLVNYKLTEEEVKMVDFTYKQIINQHFLLTKGLDLELNFAKKLAILQHASFDISLENKDTFIILQFPLSEQSYQVSNLENNEPLFLESVSLAQSKSTDGDTQPKGKILILAEKNIHTDVLKHLLSEHHYGCVIVECEIEASRLIKEKIWSLVIVDPVSSTTNYFSWMKETRAHYSLIQLPILYVSTWGKLNETNLAFEAGANDYVQKPVEGKELIARVETLTLMKKTVTEAIQLEAAWLQSQISPHFLFNTLNTILSLQQVDKEKMDEVLDALMDVLKSKFKYQKATHLIPLIEELDTVRSYVLIEQQRFQNKLQVIYDIETVENVNILPLTIQPLVENAIKHGILPMQRQGILTIRVKNYNNFVRIEIADNGAGMTEDETQSLLKNEFEKTRGIGVVNTNLRLQKEFNTKLQIKSVIDEGTSFYFDLPKNKKIK